VSENKKINFVDMNLANYINDLLYRYDCVIVPNFGGFIANKIGAVLEEETHTFYPPTKKIGFNSNLKHNDGLLANYIASSEDISFEAANKFIDTTVYKWLINLESEVLEISGVGNITLNAEKQLIFDPKNTANFLTESFGLGSLVSPIQERYQEKVIPLHTAEEIEEISKESEGKGIAGFVKYAAAIAIVLTLGAIGVNQYNKVQQENKMVAEQEQIEQKIQQATFVIENPLPTINLNVAKEETKLYHLIAGAFQSKKNANKKVSQLEEKGYNPKILGLNKWGLTQVSFESFSTREEAKAELFRIKKSGFKDAWLLVKKFD